MNAPISNYFDPKTARALCEASKCAYLEETQGVFRIDDSLTDTTVLIDQEGDDIVIAFCGTKIAHIKNCMTDLDIAFHPYRLNATDCRAHAGFYRAWQAVKERVMAYCARIIDVERTQRVWVTGHSLGGALAVMAAPDVRFMCRDLLAGVYTFGQPRVGDKSFAREYQTILGAKTFRVEHANDAVFREPPYVLGYRHAGNEVYYPPEMNGQQSGPFINPPRALEACFTVYGLIRAWQTKEEVLIGDHAVVNYLRLLDAATAVGQTVGR